MINICMRERTADGQKEIDWKVTDAKDPWRGS